MFREVFHEIFLKLETNNIATVKMFPIAKKVPRFKF
jgi:hypothetical protein